MLNFEVAAAVRATNPPPIPKAQAWGRNYAASVSAPLLDLSQGVPRSAPHPHVLDALASTASDPQAARYGPILGEPSLRQALASELNHLYGPDADSLKEERVQAGDVGITTGCNMAFLVLIMTLCPPGSAALVPVPSYFNNLMTLSLQSVSPLFIPCDPSNAFKPDLSAARSTLEADRSQGRKARAIILTTPNNPTGMVMSPAELEDWFDLAKEFRVALILDETYRDFVEPEGSSGESSRGVPHSLFARPDWRSTLVSLGSFSKGYRIPGHRLGSITASPELLEQITTVCDCMQICPPRAPQLALAPLLSSLREDLASASAQLARRRKLFLDSVSSVPGWSVDSMGGFFAYVSFPDQYATAKEFQSQGGQAGSEEVAKFLAEKVGVVTLPGRFFMPDGFESLPAAVSAAEKLKADRWIRFAVANVDDEVVVQLGPRLRQMNQLLGVEA